MGSCLYYKSLDLLLHGKARTVISTCTRKNLVVTRNADADCAMVGKESTLYSHCTYVITEYPQEFNYVTCALVSTVYSFVAINGGKLGRNTTELTRRAPKLSFDVRFKRD